MSDKLKDQLDALSALDAMPSSKPAPKHAEQHTEHTEHKSTSTHTEQEAPRESASNSQRRGKGGRNIGKTIGKILRGDLLGGETMKHQVRLILLIGFYALIMIWMRYNVESLQKEKLAATTNISYMKEHQIQIKKQYQESVRISNIAKALDSAGVGLIAGPPYEI